MSAEPDDMEQLLCSVRKNIIDNKQFLQGLVSETLDGGVDEEKEGEDEEEFVEL